MTIINIYPDRIENWLNNVIPAVNAGVWDKYHASIMDIPYFLGEIVDRFGGENAAPAKPGKDGSFSRLSRGFMNQTWDGFADVWDYQRWVYRLGCQLRQVMLPGAILLSFGGSRTWDLVSTGLRLAGWEIYPQIMVWTYSTGSPVQYSIETAARKKCEEAEAELAKAQQKNDAEGIKKWAMLAVEYTKLHKQYQGYRSNLKPAFEPIIVARNPSGMTYLERAAIGTSAMNIDACRLDAGRYPKNVIFLHHPNCVPERGVCDKDCHVRRLDEQAPNQPSGGSHGVINKKSVRVYGDFGTSSWESYDDDGSASRFYYCAKTPDWQKEAGLDDFPADKNGKHNPHPTTKPLELTEYLCRLLAPPKGIVEERRLLNPCSGVLSEALGGHLSGGWDVIDAIEQDRGYCRIAEARWQWWSQFKTIESAKSGWDGARKDALLEADGQRRMF
jgi:DNA modification methylase